MGNVTLRLWADLDNPVIESEVAQQLQAKVLEQDETATIKRVRSNPESADVGTVLEIAIMAGTHITVMGLIEGVRFVWERYKAPINVKLPDGSTIEVHGATTEFVSSLEKLVGVSVDEPAQ